MKPYLISSVFSLSLISLAQAAELTIEQQCQALGYNTKISDCEKAGSAALVCPLNDGYSGTASNDGNNMAVCITDSCRGYPLYKKNGKYYYQDQSGNEVEAVPSKGQLTDYMEGSFETCVAGYGANAVTYYRVPKCKGEALYNNYFCDVGCDTEKKYPYTYHPGNTAGTVQKCVTADQTYYGYSSCNKGWLGGWASSSGVGRCGLDDCNMVDYPYPVEPNTNHYGENRGKTETCKIGGATYYRYTECNGSDFVLKGVNTSDRKGTVCARKCEVTNCTNTPFTHTYPNGDAANINDWHCKIKNTKCTLGDIATFNGKEVGVIVELTDSRILAVPTNYTPSGTTWGNGDSIISDVPQLQDKDYSTAGKINTNGILLHRANTGYTYRFLDLCVDYQPAGCNQGFCSKGEWFLPNKTELRNLYNIKYIVANTMQYRSLANMIYWCSTEIQYNYADNLDLRVNAATNLAKTMTYTILPMLSF